MHSTGSGQKLVPGAGSGEHRAKRREAVPQGELISDEVTRQPAFFDSMGQNYAWLGGADDRLVLVIVSVYPRPISFDERWETLRSAVAEGRRASI